MVAPTFSKKERIVSSKLMETLFEKGDSQAVTAFPLKVVYLPIDRPQCSSAFPRNDSSTLLTEIG